MRDRDVIEMYKSTFKKHKHWTDKIPTWLLVIIMSVSFIGCVIMYYIITVILFILGFGKLFEG